MARFDLRKSPVDGKIRKWETKMASEVAGLETDLHHVSQSDPAGQRYDYEVQVCTGVFKNRKEVFAK